MIKEVLNKMGIIRKGKSNIKEVKQTASKVANSKNANEITKSEAAFIIAKLRKATYVGTEFEQFYQIMAKLSVLVDKE
jgi:hypothetical protein